MIALFFKYLFQFPYFKRHYFGFYKHFFSKYHLFKNETKEITYDSNLKMRLYLEDFIQQQIYFLDYYDKPSIQFLKNNLKPGDVYIDVGANVGAFALVACSHVGVQGKVIAFEPVSHVYDQLKYNVQLNHFSQMTIEKLALFNENTQLNLILSSNENLGMSSIFRHDAINGKTEIVNAVRGDDYFLQKNISRIDFIKMDIEGAELFALQGLEETLEKFKPILFVELSEAVLANSSVKKEEIITFLKKMKYEMKGIDNAGNIVELDSGEINDSENVVFLNSEIILHHHLQSTN